MYSSPMSLLGVFLFGVILWLAQGSALRNVINEVPPIIHAAITSCISNNSNDMRTYQDKVLPVYGSAASSFQSSELSSIVGQFDNILTSIDKLCPLPVLHMFDCSLTFAWLRKYLLEYKSTRTNVEQFFFLDTEVDLFENIQRTKYTNQLLDDFDTLLTVMHHANTFVKIASVRKRILNHSIELFEYICGSCCYALHFNLISAVDLVEFYYDALWHFFGALKRVIYYLVSPSSVQEFAAFQTIFGFRGIKMDESVPKMSPMAFDATVLRDPFDDSGTFTADKLATDDIDFLLRFPTKSMACKLVRANTVVDLEDEQQDYIIIKNMTIRELDRDVFNHNLGYYLIPIMHLLKSLVYFGIGNRSAFIFIHKVAMIMTCYANYFDRLYISVKTGLNPNMALLRRFIESLYSFSNTLSNTSNIKTRYLGQFVNCYFQILYDVEISTIMVGLNVYLTESDHLILNLMKRVIITKRIVIKNSYIDRLSESLTRLLSFSSHWLNSLVIFKTPPEDEFAALLKYI